MDLKCDNSLFRFQFYCREILWNISYKDILFQKSHESESNWKVSKQLWQYRKYTEEIINTSHTES